MATATTAVWVAVEGPQRTFELITNQMGPRATQVAAIRRDLWSAAFQGIRDFPLTGMGMNTFRAVVPTKYPSPLVPADMDVAHAHNQLLVTALDLGLPGLFAYAAICWISATLLVQVYRHAPERIHRAMAAGIGAGLIAHFTFGMTDAIPLGSKVSVLFWFTLALTVGLHRMALDGDGGSPRAESSQDAFLVRPPAGLA